MKNVANIAPKDKIVNADDISAMCEELRREGKKIAFSNGCFDLLHVGHLRYLYDAAQRGDVFIVGVNSDASVVRLKGSKRPICPENARAEMLCGFYFVDWVVLFDEDTPERLIALIKPDIMLKGADWAVSNLAGADFVRSYGGKVETVPLIPGESTTGIVERVAERYAR